MNIYGDEGGFTGNQLLDDQDVFTYATVAIQPDEAAELVKRILKDYRIQGSELKGRNLIKRVNGNKAVTEVLELLQGRCSVVVHHKAFALCSKFFEYVFEPAFPESNSFFYHVNFHLFVATILFLYLESADVDAEALLNAFANYARKGNVQPFSDLLPPVEKYPSLDPLKAIGLFASIHRDVISEEIGRLYEGSPSWILDLTSTSVFHQLTRWGERYGTLIVNCDESKPLRLVKPLFDNFVGETRQAYVEFQGKQHPYTFNLEEPLLLVDSALCPGVQLADVVASSAAYTFSRVNRGTVSDKERRWLPLLKDALAQVIWPDIERFTPEDTDGFVGGVILHELVDRSIEGKDLCVGLPDLVRRAMLNRKRTKNRYRKKL